MLDYEDLLRGSSTEIIMRAVNKKRHMTASLQLQQQQMKQGQQSKRDRQLLHANQQAG